MSKAEGPNPGKDDKPNKISLVVISLSGTYQDDFNVHQKLQHVFDAAFKELHIRPAAGEVWFLKYGDQTLDLASTIEQANLPEGANLMLAPREAGGGSWTAKSAK